MRSNQASFSQTHHSQAQISHYDRCRFQNEPDIWENDTLVLAPSTDTPYHSFWLTHSDNIRQGMRTVLSQS